jgi:RNA polymerase sigma-70 factor (ECF subfamily)
MINSDLEKYTDAELLTLYDSGNQAAFRVLVNRYKDNLYAFLRRFLGRVELVEEVFQETFLQLYNSKDSFDKSRPLKPWLFTIAANKAKDKLRSRQRKSAISIGNIADAQEMSFEEMINTLSSTEKEPYNELEGKEQALRVREIIAEMPENLREILIFAYFNQFSYKQMAEILSIPIGTVKSRLHTAVNRFAKDWKASFRSTKSK